MVHIDLNKKVRKYFNTVNWEKTKFELDFVYIQYVPYKNEYFLENIIKRAATICPLNYVEIIT